MVSLLAWVLQEHRYSHVLHLLVVVLVCTGFLTACEDPGVVGSDFVNTGADVNSDTLKIENYSLESGFPVFTGNKPFLSVGHYSDPIFGDITATGVMKPAINLDVDTLHPDASLALQLSISKADVYGDTASTSRLELVEMGRIWRGTAWKIDSEIQLTGTQVNGEPFEIGMQDSVVVKLTDQWYQKFRDFFYNNPANRDSLYRYDFKGFALVPTQGNKILAIDASNSHFLLQNPDDTVAVELGLSDWGYSLERKNIPSLPDTLTRIYSTREQVVSFDFKSNRQTLGSENISQAVLSIAQAHERMEASLPKGHTRPTPDVLNLYLHRADRLKFSLATFQPAFRVQIDSVDFTYQADVTRYVNQQLFGSKIKKPFIGTLRSNDGIIRSALIANPKASTWYPKVLLTTVNPDLESD